MAWSGGIFTRVLGGVTTWVTDLNANIKILASRHDTNDNDIATGINACLTKNGENTFTGSAGALRGSVDNSVDLGSASLRWQSLFAGTSVVFQGAAFAATVTSAPTANRAIVIPDLAGTVALRSEIPPTITHLTSGVAQTFTTAATTVSMIVECWGPGGPSGGVDGTVGQTAVSGGGSGGGYSYKYIAVPSATYTYTVGDGGTGGASGNFAGVAGAATTFTDGALTLTANPGAASPGATATAGSAANNGAIGGTATGGDVNLTGGYSSARCIVGGVIAQLPMSGAAPRMGGGVPGNVTGAGIVGAVYGDGGGAAHSNDATNYAGAAGGGGLIRITQFK